MKRYYIADLHFDHFNMIRYCGRPFATAEEMNETMIRRWNEVVEDGDMVYVLGDLMLNRGKRPERHLARLKGRLVLLKGNHDDTWLPKVDTALWFEQASDRLEIMDGDRLLTLTHEPLLDLRSYAPEENRYQIHGHIHNNTHMEAWPSLRENPRILNASVEVTGDRPLTFDQLLQANVEFKEKHP